ncbi:MAG: HEAT repeat domain-containing protein [Planctomycetes bacterium]|nr:HEAT repeat domain-containing protein [Planctomycetota bacterium]
MSDLDDWKAPSIGLVLIGVLLLCGGGIKLSTANTVRSRRKPPVRKPYRPKKRKVKVAPMVPARTTRGRRNTRRPRGNTRRPINTNRVPPVVAPGRDTGPGADDRKTLRSDPDANLRAFAASALGSLRPVRESTLTVLTNALKDKDALVRSSAADAIGGFGRRGRRARSALYRASSDSDPEVKRAARAALRKLR